MNIFKVISLLVFGLGIVLFTLLVVELIDIDLSKVPYGGWHAGLLVPFAKKFALATMATLMGLGGLVVYIVTFLEEHYDKAKTAA